MRWNYEGWNLDLRILSLLDFLICFELDIGVLSKIEIHFVSFIGILNPYVCGFGWGHAEVDENLLLLLFCQTSLVASTTFSQATMHGYQIRV